MSRLYDTIEPSVIDESLLKQAVEEQGPTGEAGKVAKEEGVDFETVKSLRLDFKNILKIDNLWQLTSLVKLQLDNNIIEKIEGLSILKHLTWLDLSFNNIEEIEGLEKLVNLTDLTLHNNRIEKLQGMETLSQLTIFSIGNNKLEHLEGVAYLRQFKELKTLNLSGNPVCKDENYTPYVISHLPDLVYLDYRLVDENARTTAIDQYKYAIEELNHDENVAHRKQEEEKEKIAQQNLEKAAFVGHLRNAALFQSMMEDDAEGEKLIQLPGAAETFSLYKEHFCAICDELCEYGLEQEQIRKQEINEFYQCIEEAINSNKREAMSHIRQFDGYKTKLFADLSTVADSDIIDLKLRDADEAVQRLWDELMHLEMQLVDQLEETIKDFERSMSDLMAQLNEHVKALMSQCRDLENNHHEKLSDIAAATLEQLMKSEVDEEISDELRMLLIDKETVLNAVAASHDAHTTAIDTKEDKITTSAENSAHVLQNKVTADEIRRNRKRVEEINNLIDNYRDELETIEVGPS